jgi:D-3-phosphoglycerate dehydrogenase
MKKQIVILEELSVPQETLQTLFSEQKLTHEIVWDEDKVEDSAMVEVLVTVKTAVDESLLQKYPNVTCVAVAFTGYDCVDLEACSRSGIDVVNVPTYSTNSVSELVLGHAISLLRNIPQSDTTLRQGKWDVHPGKELAGKTVGILGTGAIGVQTARLFKAFGCQVVGWSRTQRPEFSEVGTYIDDMHQFLSVADIVSIHVPLHADTKGLVAAQEFAAMKETAYIINTSRGPIIDELALITALKNREIAGAALDVFTTEPVSADNELLVLPNTILTPHIAYKTEEALERRAAITVDNIAKSLQGNPVHKVN